MIIGIYSSQPQSGKTTAAEALIDEGFVQCKFAGPMYSALYGLLKYIGLSHDEIVEYFEEKKEEKIPGFGHSVREFMQKFGTEFGRDMLDECVWINCAQMNIESERLKGNESFVFDDLRFANEKAYLESVGGICIKLVNVNKEKVEATHRSEGALDNEKFDYIVENSGTVEDLQNEIRAIARGCKEESRDSAEEPAEV